MPNPAAVSFIFLTNASSDPESQRASSRATLLAEGSISSSSAWYWLSCCPSVRVTRDSSTLPDSWAACLSTVIFGPPSPFFSGCA